MNCTKCNAPLGANDAFCLNCGTKAPQQPQYAAPSAYTDPASYAAAPAGAPAVAKKKPSFQLDKLLKGPDGKINKLVPIVAGALVVVILAIIIISSVTGSAKSVAKKYLNAGVDGDYAKALSCEYIDKSELKKLVKSIAKESGMSEKEIYADIAAILNEADEDYNADFDSFNGYVDYMDEVSAAEMKEELEETYGSDYKIKIEIDDVEDCTSSQEDDYRDSIDDAIRSIEKGYDVDLSFDSDDAKAFKEVEYTVSIEGSEDAEEEEGTLILVKINGDWKVYENDCSSTLLYLVSSVEALDELGDYWY